MRFIVDILRRAADNIVETARAHGIAGVALACCGLYRLFKRSRWL